MISGNTFNDVIMQNEFIVCDWDGVIQSIEYTWMENLLKVREDFEPYFDFSKILDENGNLDCTDIINRDTYYLDKWLLKENAVLPKELSEKFTDIYMNDIIFYDKCPFLNMANGLKTLLTQDFIKKIVFLSSAPLGRLSDPRKMVQLIKFFGSSNLDRIDIKVIAGNVKKSDFINKFYPNYTTFIDDRSDIIRDVIDNTNSDNKNFILPVYRYNTELGNDEKYILNAKNRGINISTYKNEIIK